MTVETSIPDNESARRPSKLPTRPGRFLVPSRRWLGPLGVLIVVTVWWGISQLGIVKPLFLPSPQAVWEAFVQTASDGYRGIPIWEHLLVSLQRVGLGLLFGTLVAIPLGIAIGMSPILEALIEPLINFYRPLPPLGYYTIVVVWFGIGESSKVILLALAAFPPLFLGTIGGVRGVRADRLHAARSLGATRLQTMTRVVIPSSLPEIFTGLRISAAGTYTTVVAAELIAADKGIGWVALNASHYLQTDVVFMAIILMGITGLLIDVGLKLLQQRMLPWVGKA